MKKIMLIYPPGHSFQRGEDRCQIDIDSSSVNNNRACNDLGYISSCLKKNNYNIYLKDYQAEKLTENDLFHDFNKYNPDVLFISTTNGSIFSDLEIIKKIKHIKKDIIIILKGAIFFNPEKELLNKLDLINVDYLIGGEVEFIIENLIDAHFNDKSMLINIQGISYKKNGNWIIQNVIEFNDNLDSLPFPDRSAMNNKLYINPETNRPMAIITTSKGCCFDCIYCLSPVISGKKVRYRSIENIFYEIKDCIEKYNISDFFFKSDTFTVNKNNVIKLCELLIQSGLNKKINWVATARVDTLDEELVKIMKKSGCSLLSIGFESGSQDTLNRISKKTNINQNINAAKICKKYGIRILGHFLTGFPWENEKHLKETQKHIFEINPDYIEISIVVPYYNTPLFNELYKNKNPDFKNILGHDSYNNIVENTSFLSINKLKKFKRDTLMKFYLRPFYIIQKIKQIKSFHVLNNYIYYGLRLIKNLIF